MNELVIFTDENSQKISETIQYSSKMNELVIFTDENSQKISETIQNPARMNKLKIPTDGSLNTDKLSQNTKKCIKEYPEYFTTEDDTRCYDQPDLKITYANKRKNGLLATNYENEENDKVNTEENTENKKMKQAKLIIWIITNIISPKDHDLVIG
ncbi:21528_t:CDS:2 [Gigaspora margarita]|uniref:21528_t:CDS:1 n=1 Tax=Gigaspora margarita TaxID=4874 RepID=A0ABN7VKK3_GIGMA|nr:21528_t:CDS:2 [Gigaspora margarita]